MSRSTAPHRTGRRAAPRWLLAGTAALTAVGLLAPAASATPGADAAGLPRLANGGFEEATASGRPADWTVRPGRAADAVRLTAGGHSGAHHLTLGLPAAPADADAGAGTGTGEASSAAAPAGGAPVEARQRLRGLDRGEWTLTAWVRASGEGAGWIALENCGGPERRTAVPAGAGEEWVRVVVSTTVRGGACTAVLGGAGTAGAVAEFDDVTLTPGGAPLAIRGGDVSTLPKALDLGATFADARGREAEALDVLAAGGMNYARLRIWVDPADGYTNKEQTLRIAREIKARGMGLLVDFHYSDTWADPGKQFKPAAWESHTPDQLEQAVHDHTYDVLKALADQGTPADMAQIGNEINGGMLWPDGRYDNWDQLAAFLRAGVAGSREASPDTAIVLHIADAGKLDTVQWWFDQATARGVDFDVIGLSYYSYWHGSLDELQTTLDTVTARYGKPVAVVETAYPFTLEEADHELNVINPSSPVTDGYPVSPAGQAANFRDVQSVVQAVPGGMGLGVFYWEPTWTAVPGLGWDPADPSSGDGWENQAVFDFDGHALPAVREFRAR
ncbi:glycoside hydrolase family 53 protein [Allostreptomyces psammosilenae]|uniref:Arabinogalactan endo-beta-1,4-galactanase n=1 Tax=Allostreptomyces psammosilenae TaxID=1892865 RepID=A0A852ZX16_9ACTN|nr:arabinogalactan endo-1,4-beta-galactosidase [Allostreptomyces psammosilenae]NYI06906.1 arabinogalactan endo-1,4-beta-galactosidase [Allostreptomyces psammosilenae]